MHELWMVEPAWERWSSAYARQTHVWVPSNRRSRHVFARRQRAQAQPCGSWPWLERLSSRRRSHRADHDSTDDVLPLCSSWASWEHAWWTSKWPWWWRRVCKRRTQSRLAWTRRDSASTRATRACTRSTSRRDRGRTWATRWAWRRARPRRSWATWTCVSCCGRTWAGI